MTDGLRPSRFFAIVDDRPEVLDGRAGWLRDEGYEVATYSFTTALLNSNWQHYDTVVLDGRDDSVVPHRPRGLPDRFLGARVAQHIRSSRQVPPPTLILISMYARTHPELALRCAQSGVDYIFEYRDVSGRIDFLNAVLMPDQPCPTPVATDWRHLGFERAPNVPEAVALTEEDPAGVGLLGGTPTGAEYARRRLRERVGRVLPLKTDISPMGRHSLPGERILRSSLRRFLGLNDTEL